MIIVQLNEGSAIPRRLQLNPLPINAGSNSSCCRTSKDRVIVLLINHGSYPLRVPLPTPMADVLQDEVSVCASILDPKGMAVLLSQAQQASP